MPPNTRRASTDATRLYREPSVRSVSVRPSFDRAPTSPCSRAMVYTGCPAPSAEPDVPSTAFSTPRLKPEILPVIFAAATGCTIRLVYTRFFGVLKNSVPSRKNGRFSGKNSACRGSYDSWLASDSICEKSGLTVPLSVKLLLIPHRTLPPIFGRSASYRHDGPTLAGSPVVRWVISGVTSSTRPRRRSVSPFREPDWRRNDALS